MAAIISIKLRFLVSSFLSQFTGHRNERKKVSRRTQEHFWKIRRQRRWSRPAVEGGAEAIDSDGIPQFTESECATAEPWTGPQGVRREGRGAEKRERRRGGGMQYWTRGSEFWGRAHSGQGAGIPWLRALERVFSSLVAGHISDGKHLESRGQAFYAPQPGHRTLHDQPEEKEAVSALSMKLGLEDPSLLGWSPSQHAKAFSLDSAPPGQAFKKTKRCAK